MECTGAARAGEDQGKEKKSCRVWRIRCCGRGVYRRLLHGPCPETGTGGKSLGPDDFLRGERLCAGVGGILKISGKESSGGLFPGEDPGDL